MKWKPLIYKLIRSGLFFTPRLYRVLTSQPRYVVLHRLGRVHEPEFRLFPDLVSSERPLILDVGGNIGQSVLSIFTVLPDARVVTFEPNPVNLSSLQRLERRFAGQLTVEAYGLAGEAATADLYWPVYNGKEMLALASFDYDAAAGFIGPDTVYGYRPSKLKIEHARLPLRRLDDFDLRPDLIKVDVQGLEAEVIQGGMSTIRRTLPVIMAEGVSEDSPALATLRPLGYTIWVGSVNSLLLPPGRAASELRSI